MLIEFKVKNFLSFKEEAVFSMVAGAEKSGSESLMRLQKFHLKILPTAAVFGANGAGKSSLLKGLCFLQNIMVAGGGDLCKKASLLFYKFSEESRDQNTCFSVSMLIEDLIYTFEVRLNQKGIVFEKLSRQNSRSTQDIYVREGRKFLLGPKAKHLKGAETIARQAAEDQLLLPLLSQLKFDVFTGVYQWFTQKLQIIAPATAYLPAKSSLSGEKEKLEAASKLLCRVLPGFSELSAAPADRKADSGELQKDSLKSLEPQTGSVLMKDQKSRPAASAKGGNSGVEKIFLTYLTSRGKRRTLSLEEESDGTQRLVHLALLLAASGSAGPGLIYLVDDLDLNFHPDLTQELPALFISSCEEESRNQLIFTTHDTNLLRRSSLRRDEIWFVEKTDEGSFLSSAAEFRGLRSDSSLQKLYEEGRFGALPKI